MRRTARLALFCSLLFAAEAGAHDADILYVRVAPSATPDGADVQVTLTLTAAALSALAPVDADRDGQLTQEDLDARKDSVEAGVWEQVPLKAGRAPCARGDTGTLVRESYVELSASYECPAGELSQTYRLLSVLPSGFRVIAADRDGTATQRFAEGNAQTIVFSDAPPGVASGSKVEGFHGWIALGVFHIFTGIDHIAFLVALLLVGGSWKRILGLVTSFTLAHSITLGATSLGYLVLSESAARYVEAAIAASIIYIAVENLVMKGERKHRVLITFLFGLVHGFGFASVLTGYGLGEGAAKALFGFNVGVELGQASLVAPLWLLLKLTQRWPEVNAWTLRVGSGVTLAAGAYWLTERLLG